MDSLTATATATANPLILYDIHPENEVCSEKCTWICVLIIIIATISAVTTMLILHIL